MPRLAHIFLANVALALEALRAIRDEMLRDLWSSPGCLIATWGGIRLGCQHENLDYFSTQPYRCIVFVSNQLAFSWTNKSADFSGK